MENNDRNKRFQEIRSVLGFVFLPNIRASVAGHFTGLAFWRHFFLGPLVVSGLLPPDVLSDGSPIVSNIFLAIQNIAQDVAKKNWHQVALKVPALGSVLGFALFLFGMLVTLFAGLLLETANAQDLGAFAGEPGRAKEILAIIFGITGNAGADGSLKGSLGDMLFIYNAGMAAMAILLISYQIIYLFALKAENNKGERNDDDGKPVWFIIRCVLVLVLISPFPGGFSGGQHAILYLAKTGSVFATKVWTEFANNTLQTGSSIATPKPPKAINQIIGKMLMVQTCMESANIMAKRAGDAPYIEANQKTNTSNYFFSHPVYNDGVLPNQTVLNYDGRVGVLPRKACGQIKFPVYNENQNLITKPVIKAQLDAFRATIPAIIKLARDLSAHFVPGTPQYGTPMPNPGRIMKERGLSRLWFNALTSGIRDASSLNNDALNARMTKQLNEGGWITAGAWFQTIAKVNGEFIDASLALPTIILPRQKVREKIPVTANVLHNLDLWWQDYGNDHSFAATLQSTTLETSGGSDILDKLWEYIDLNSALDYLVADSGSPMADLSALGHYLVNTSLSGFVAIGAAGVASLGAMTALLLFFGVALLAILIPGATLAWYLPLLPFIRFIFGVLGWLLNLVEAVVLLPLFLFSHLGVTQKNILNASTRAGYFLLLQLALKPVLMIFGLVTGLLVFNAIMDLFNALFLPTVIAANNGSQAGFISFTFNLILYVTTAYGLANMSFKAIDILSSRAITWLGGVGFADGNEFDATKGASGRGFGKLEEVAGKTRLGVKKK